MGDFMHSCGISSSESDAPLAALRPSSQIMLSTLLNPTKVIPSESGLPRDWRGLAELAGIPSENVSYLQAKSDPTAELIQMWCKSSESRCRYFSDLQAFLAVIDRFDVAEDVAPLLANDSQAYRDRQRNDLTQASSELIPLDPSQERNILTIEDSERIHNCLPLTRYDAFILHADEDSEFANQVVDKLENEYKLKLCVKQRDLLPGVMFEHEVIGRLIEERCNRFLVIFSPSFLQSSANQFLLSYAQASALESRVRKIVPCMYQQCDLPPSVRYCFSIKYNRSGKLYNFWDKLNQSLRSSLPAKSTNGNPASLPISTGVSNSIAEKLKDPLSDESLKWWDADKDKPTPSPPPSYSQAIDSENYNMKSNLLMGGDTVSTPTDAHSKSTENVVKKNKKWYKKLTIPNKLKKEKDKSNVKQATPNS